MEFVGPGIGPLSLSGNILNKNYFVSLLILSVVVVSETCLAAVIPSSSVNQITVRVLVDKIKDNYELSGFDLVAQDVTRSHKQLVGADGQTKLNFHCRMNGHVEIRKEVPGKSTNQGLPVISHGPVKISSLGGFIRSRDKRFREEVYIYSSGDGGCQVVNHVDLEKYVAGLLNSEMNASWNLETLKAQAVAARTYAIYQMKESAASAGLNSEAPFDLEATVKDQVYDGAHQEKYKAIKAAMETKGQILSYLGKPIKAFYHSTCGGQTVSADKMWGMRINYMIPVQCGYCNQSPRFRWHYEASREDIEMALKLSGLIKNKLMGVRVAAYNQLGRVKDVEVMDGMNVITVAATKFRELVGYQKIKSTSFRAYRQGEKFFFDGSGSGHGVGLCQWGAKRMAEVGMHYDQILKKYYPMAKLTKLY